MSLTYRNITHSPTPRDLHFRLHKMNIRIDEIISLFGSLHQRGMELSNVLTKWLKSPGNCLFGISMRMATVFLPPLENGQYFPYSPTERSHLDSFFGGRIEKQSTPNYAKHKCNVKKIRVFIPGVFNRLKSLGIGAGLGESRLIQAHAWSTRVNHAS